MAEILDEPIATFDAADDSGQAEVFVHIDKRDTKHPYRVCCRRGDGYEAILGYARSWGDTLYKIATWYGAERWNLRWLANMDPVTALPD